MFLILNHVLHALRFKNLPPGPPSLPIVGNLHHIKRPLHRTFKSLSQKYGHVISLWFGSRLVVVVSSPSVVQECFTKNDLVLANRPQFLTGEYALYNHTTLGSSAYGDHWRNLRRIASLDVLSTRRLSESSEIRVDERRRLMQRLAKEAEDNWSWSKDHDDFAEVELTSKLYDMTFNNVMRMISGKRFYGDPHVEGEAKQFRTSVTELLDLYGAVSKNDFLPALRLLDYENLEKRLKKISKITDTFLEGLIRDHRASRMLPQKQKQQQQEEDRANAGTMIDHLLSLQESQADYYTDEIIKGLALNMLLAGTDTSAVTLAWAMSLLLNHPETLEKARDELETHVGQDRFLHESDLPKLPCLKNIVYETLRLYHPAPLLMPHLSSDECVIGGYKVPRDTILLINAWSINRDPQVWSEATSFKPDRFDQNEQELRKLIAFGMGRRACPGEDLAMSSVVLTLGWLIQCFQWKQIGDKEIDMREKDGFMLSRLAPLRVMCKAQPIISKLMVK